ncbi:MAG: hypothetical protein H7Y31_15540 [Chitinophagaceae bacterium]|nr:hypothetical protein [Chitinophagaceae bacterium]
MKPALLFIQQTSRLILTCNAVLCLCLCVPGCRGINGNSFSPKLHAYESDDRQMIVLKRPLREISGIDFLKEDLLVAINDEAGKIFFLNPMTGAFTASSFGKKDDYEDVVKTEDHFFVMNSKGHLFEVSGDGERQIASYKNSFGKRMEFETLVYDRAANRLLLICKECGKQQNSVDAYVFDLASRSYVEAPVFSIPWESIRRLAKDNSIECKPSAGAINPVDGKLYVIAALGKVLMQCSVDGALLAVYKLNPDHFPQPEGISFSNTGDMYIANEGVQGKGTLLKFKYTPVR